MSTPTPETIEQTPELDTVDAPSAAAPETAPAEPEVKNPAGLLAKNRELLARLGEQSARLAELEAKATEHDAQIDAWRARHQATIDKALLDELGAISVPPAKYLLDVCVEAGLLAFETDADGLKWPVWRDINRATRTKPDRRGHTTELRPASVGTGRADLSHGLRSYLGSAYSVLGIDDLGRCLPGTTAMGGGASGNGSGVGGAPSAPAAAAPAQLHQTGLR